MKIIILSDLHITENGVKIWDTDTLAHFLSAKSLIAKEPNVDAVIICGDIADAGSSWVYNYVSSELNSLRMPVYYVPGNHDSIVKMKEVFHQNALLSSFEINDWKFILLNSVMSDPHNPNKNMARGFLNEHDLRTLKEELETEKKVCIVLHHPPIEQDGWLNRKLLDNKEELDSIIANDEKIRLVLYGHTHFHSTKKLGHITYICAPSVGFAFNNDLPKFQIDEGNEGFLTLNINGDEIDCIINLIK